VVVLSARRWQSVQDLAAKPISTTQVGGLKLIAQVESVEELVAKMKEAGVLGA
jgi:hypothetical protein